MPLCLFCDDQLKSDTKPEHILLNALGGRLERRDLICSACNGCFGSSIDADLAAQVASLRNMLQLPSGRRRPPPAVARETRQGPVTFGPDGRPKYTGKPFEIGRNDGSPSILIQSGSIDTLPSALDHAAGVLGCTTEQLWAGNGGPEPRIRKTFSPVATEEGQFSLGGAAPGRSITKACLELLATLVGNDAVRAEPFAAARGFVLRGDNDFLTGRYELDSRSIPDQRILVEDFGERFTLIYVASDGEGRTIGHFTLYNLIGWQVVLAERGGPPDIQIGLVSDPQGPARWSSRIAETFALPFDWLDAPHFDGEAAPVRFRAMFATLYQQSVQAEIGRIVEEEFRNHGIVGDVMIDDDTVRRDLFALITGRVAALLTRTPFAHDLDPQTVKATISRNLV